MPITADWQAELRGLTVGSGTDYQFTGPIDGLGIPKVRSGDSELPRRHGDYGGYDVLARRVLAFPLGIVGDSLADTYQKLQALKAAWKPSIADLGLDIRLAGQPATVLRYYGRPRGIDADLTRLRNSWADLLLTFEALDPLGYGAEVTTTITGSGPVTNAGDADTDRVILTINGNGGTPRVENSTTGGHIAFARALAGGSAYTVDLRARTVLLGATARYEDVSPGSNWFVLASGANTIVVTGAADVDVTFRPAYH